MPQITARVSDDLAAELDRAAETVGRNRADVIRQALVYYLDDVEDLRLGIAALRDPADAVLDWNAVRDDLLGRD